MADQQQSKNSTTTSHNNLNGAAHKIIHVEDQTIPNNVSSMEQVKALPPEFKSLDKDRPLQHTNDRGETFKYSLNPLRYSVLFILMVELLERFSFYGINYTQTSFLTGVYDPDWNADMSAVAASSYVSVSIAIAYTAPFCGALLADSCLGDYWTILFGATLFYIPGLLLILLTTIPHLWGTEQFNKSALGLGLLAMWPLGTGIVKSVVNVFGAKQFHPLLQSALIETYYVNFYMCINIGALAGGIVIPILAQTHLTMAYSIPVLMLVLGVSLFSLGTPKYVLAKPRGELLSSDGPASSSTLNISTILKISALIIPFNIAYSQMATTFIVQGTVMRKEFGFLDAASMNNADALSVLFFGYWIGNKLYPWLADRGTTISTTQKFAIGSALGAFAIAWALLVEYQIHHHFEETGDTISVLWQIPAYVMIGAGEIFCVSSAYEVAFTAAPPQKKALASAINLFCVGGLPNVLCIMLYHACSPWFQNKQGTSNIHLLGHYCEASVYKYFLVLLGIAVLGILLNLLPSIQQWVESIEDEAADAVKTPKPTPPKRYLVKQRRAMENKLNSDDDEKIPLMEQMKRLKEHSHYLEYGSGPILHKSGSMRAGPFLTKTDPKTLEKQKKYLREKYRSITRPTGTVTPPMIPPPARTAANTLEKNQDGSNMERENQG